MRCVAIALGISVCTVVTAQNPGQFGEYSSPSKWNNFNIVPPVPQQQSTNYMRTVSTGVPKNAKTAGEGTAEILPAPKGTHTPQPRVPQPHPAQRAPMQQAVQGQPPMNHHQPQHNIPQGMEIPGGFEQGYSTPDYSSQGYSSQGMPSPVMNYQQPTYPSYSQAPMQAQGDCGCASPHSGACGGTNCDGPGFGGFGLSHGGYGACGTPGYGYGDCGPNGGCGLGLGLGLGAGHFVQNGFGAGGYANTGVRPQLQPWFGGFNLLFWKMDNNYDRRLISVDGTRVPVASIGDVHPDNTTGYDLFFGRYLDCGRYGLSAGYMNFDPGLSQRVYTPAVAGDYYAPIQSWNGISIDPDGAGAAPVSTVYALYDGASAYRLTRDVDVQGIEINLHSFGLMGAQRAAAMCSQGDCTGLGNSLGFGGIAGACYGYGGATGPLVRSTSGRVRVSTSHGMRWFQFQDAMEFAANIDGAAGYQSTDLFHNIDIDNNLLGYQFGSRLTYCMSNRLNLGVAGKFGIYGNKAEMNQRLGTGTIVSYENGMPSELVSTHSSDTSLATLGELDLGLGYRLNNAWTLTGGYRVLGVSGIATTPTAIDQDYSDVTQSGIVQANDSLLLHGAYVGMNFNW